MSVLTFTADYSEKKWKDFLVEILGEDLASQAHIESHGTAKKYSAKVLIDKYKHNPSLEEKLKKNEHIHSIFLIKNGSVKAID